MHRILIIPDERFPAHQAVMAEVFSKETNLFQSVFLMRSFAPAGKKTMWNQSQVYLIPFPTKNPLINKLASFCRMDVRFAYLIPYLVYKERISIIQVRDLTFPLLVALLCKLCFGKKVVYQKSFPMEYDRLESAEDPSRAFSRLRLGIRRLENSILHKAMRFADAILPISSYMADNLYREHHIPKRKLHPFGMGYNFTDSPGPTNLETQLPTVCKVIYVGTLEEARQFDVLIRGLALAVQRLGEGNISIEFVGGTPSQIDELHKLVVELDLNKCLTFIGYVQREEAYERIAKSHIGISWFGSHVRYQDACPTKMMEYLAMGLPILAVDSVLMHRDVVHATGAGALCQIDPESVAQGLSLLITDFAPYKRRALAASEYVKEHFSYTSMRTEITRLYDALEAGQPNVEA